MERLLQEAFPGRLATHTMSFGEIEVIPPAADPQAQEGIPAAGPQFVTGVPLNFPEKIGKPALAATLSEALQAEGLVDADFELVATDQTAGSEKPCAAWALSTSLDPDSTRKVLDQMVSNLADTPVYLSANAIGGKVDVEQAAGGLEGHRRRHTGIDEPHPRRGLPVHGFASCGKLHRRPRADQPRQPHGAAPAGKEAELDLRQAELGVRLGRGHAEIAGQSQFQPATEAGPIDDRHGGRGCGEPAEQLLAGGTERLDLGRRQVSQPFQPVHIGSGKERTLPARPKDQAAGSRPMPEGIESGRQVGQNLPGEDVVAVVRNREGEHRDPVGGPLNRDRGRFPGGGRHR